MDVGCILIWSPMQRMLRQIRVRICVEWISNRYLLNVRSIFKLVGEGKAAQTHYRISRVLIGTKIRSLSVEGQISWPTRIALSII